MNQRMSEIQIVVSDEREQGRYNRVERRTAENDNNLRRSFR